MLPDALAQLVREAGGDALLLDARHARGLITDSARVEGLCKNLRNAGFARLIDFMAEHIGAAGEDGRQGRLPHQEFWLLLTLRHPGYGHAALTLKWKWVEGGRAAVPGRHSTDQAVADDNGITGRDARAPGFTDDTMSRGAGQPGGQPLQAGPVVHPTLSTIWPAAGLAEREIFEMFGIPFAGNENLAPLLLDEQFQGFPLRRDYATPAQESYAARLLRERHEQGMINSLRVGAAPMGRPGVAQGRDPYPDTGGPPTPPESPAGTRALPENEPQAEALAPPGGAR